MIPMAAPANHRSDASTTGHHPVITSHGTTVAQLISHGTARLQHSSDSPTLDAEVLLAYILELDRTALLQHAVNSVSTGVADLFQRLVTARRRGIPVAYLTGRQAFMDFDLTVTPYTLIPRPFTETVVTALLEQLGSQPHVLADIGTGSGAIALAVAKHRPNVRIIATDVSVSALRVAATNARRHDLLRRIDFRSGPLLHPVRTDDTLTAVAANLPYLPTVDLRERSIRHEPALALDGGVDGLALIEQLLTQTRFFPSLRLVALELLPEQADAVAYLLRRYNFSVQTISDGHAVRGLLGQK